MVEIGALARRLGLRFARYPNTNMLVLSGDRGTIVFNPGLRGVVIGSKVHFRGHRVVINGGRVSVPPGFIEECEKYLAPARLKEVEPEQMPIDKPKPRFHVVLDPGHGGKDPGAVGANGGYEKTVNLVVSRLVAEELRAANLKVTMTRTGDCFVDLNDRPAVGNRLRADVFVSIHADSAVNKTARGFTLFVCHTKYSDASRASLVCREYDLGYGSVRSILTANRERSKHLASLIRLQMRKVPSTVDRGTQLGAFRVLRRSICPAVLVELGFMSNAVEARRLADPAYRKRLASAVARGIILFLGGK